MINARIIARTLVLTVTLLLSACSTVRLAYNQAPHLVYWWLDDYADFSSAQAPQVKQDIEAFLDWHRHSELPGYAALLEQWQAMATQDITPAQACAQVDAIRAALVRAGERGLEPLTRMALALSPEQLANVQKSQTKSNETFEKDFLRGNAEQRLDKRLDKALDRLEMLYGRLTAAQRERLRRGLQMSPFDPQKTLQERLRRQADLRQSIVAMQTSHPGAGNQTIGQSAPAAAVEVGRQYMGRLLQSPTPGYKAYDEGVIRQGCDTFATLHNSTTAQQRQHALRVLQGYEDDLRALTAQR